MKTSEILLQLYASLPAQTDKFTEFADIISITSSGLVATVTTTTDHNLLTGNYITVCDGKKQTPIVSISRVDDILTVVTSTDHDLTQNVQETIEIVGATEPEFNGEFVLFNVPNRRTFTLGTVDSGATVATGSPVLMETTGFGYNGLHQITVTGSDTLTYELQKDLGGLDVFGVSRIAVGHRVTGAASADRAFTSYTDQNTNQLWGYVVLGNVVSSKNRHIENDSLEFKLPGTDYRQKLTHPFSVYVFTPSTDDIIGRRARDEMEDIARFLVKCLSGVAFDNGWAQKDEVETVFSGHSFREYNVSYYIHQFDFQSSSEITKDDTAETNFTVAFRGITFAGENDLGEQQFTANINLDDEPL